MFASKRRSSFGVFLLVGLVAAAILLFALSHFYKSSLIKNKQAPFAVPGWMPESLFPRFDFYYEHEMSRRLRGEEYN